MLLENNNKEMSGAYPIDIGITVRNKIKKEITSLYVSFFYILEDMKLEGRISEEEYSRIRKRILDYGNNAVRNINDDLDNLDISFKRRK